MLRLRARSDRAGGLCAAAMAGAALLAGCVEAPSVEAPTPEDILINGAHVFPESATSDSAGNVYVGSLGGTIYRASPGAGVAEPWIEPGPGNGLLSLFGVLADEAHGALWVCSNPNPFTGAGKDDGSSLLAFDLASGAFRARFPFPEGPAACNDAAVAGDGELFVTETAGGRIFRLAPGAAALELFADGEALIGVDGIAFADDGTMYVNNVRQNLVQRVERGGDGAYAGLTDLKLSEPVSGPDGLRPVGGHVFVQAEGSGGRVALIEVDGDKAKVTPLRTGLASSPGVTLAGRVGYATEGKIGYLIDPALKGQDPGEFYIRAFTLPEGL